MGKRKMDSDLHRIKLETGTVYQTSKGGNYYFRYQVQGERKCVSLKTANQEEAIRKAKELLPTVQATNLEVIATHVKVARKLAANLELLLVSHFFFCINFGNANLTGISIIHNQCAIVICEFINLKWRLDIHFTPCFRFACRRYPKTVCITTNN